MAEVASVASHTERLGRTLRLAMTWGVMFVLSGFIDNSVMIWLGYEYFERIGFYREVPLVCSLFSIRYLSNDFLLGALHVFPALFLPAVGGAVPRSVMGAAICLGSSLSMRIVGRYIVDPPKSQSVLPDYFDLWRLLTFALLAGLLTVPGDTLPDPRGTVTRSAMALATAGLLGTFCALVTNLTLNWTW